MRIPLPYVLLLAALALGAAFDVLFYEHEPNGINMPLAELLFLGFSLAIAKAQKLTIPTAAKIAGGFALAFSASIAIWTSDASLPLAYLGFFISNVLFAVFMLGEAAHFRHPFDVIASLVIGPIRHSLNALPFVRTLKPERLSPKTASVIKSLVIATPILLVFVAIFAAADPVFDNYLQNAGDWIERWFDIGNLISHGLFIGFFVVLFTLFFAATFWKRHQPLPLPQASAARAVLESKIILGSVAILFAVFLLISGSALFGGQAAFADLGVTYSEYARQGFGQLSAAATLVIGLIMTLRVLHSENVDKKLLGLQSVLLIEAGLVLISAFMRLSLYIGAYGYTPARLFGLWFFALVGVLLLMTLENVVRGRGQHLLVSRMLILCGVAMLLFVASAPDARTVSLNLARAEAGHEINFRDTIRLSEEAIPQMLRVKETSVEYEDIKGNAPDWDKRLATKASRYENSWQTWNYSRWYANLLLK